MLTEIELSKPKPDEDLKGQPVKNQTLTLVFDNHDEAEYTVTIYAALPVTS